MVNAMRVNPLKHRQSGQALIVGLVFLFLGAFGLAFLFNTGQVGTAKQKLVNSTDAAAYSAALWRARVMNFHAYSNRAIIAQEVAVAQAVTLVSWALYFKTATQNIADYTSWFPPAWALQYLAYAADYNSQLVNAAAEIEIPARAAQDVGYKELLQKSQEVLNLTVNVFAMGAVANEIVKANSPNHFAFALPSSNDLTEFTRRYASDEDRQRLKAVVNASLDPFVTTRGAEVVVLPPGQCVPTSFDHRASRIIKRGGTTMGDGLERWEAGDTLSTHIWMQRRRLDPRCGREPEVMPIGYGAGETSNNDSAGTLLHNPGHSSSVNPLASQTAEDDMWSNTDYAGIGKVRELNYEGLSNTKFPTAKVAILGRQENATLHTTSQLRVSSGRLQLPDSLARGRLWALSAAEVYFKPPGLNRGQVEYASLYSPFWQARLVPVSTTDRASAEIYVAN